ncbi:DUF4351 domain-containing protein [Nocardia fluminea]
MQAVVTDIMTVGETDPADFDPLIDRLEPRAKEVIVTTGEMLRAEGEANLLIRLLGRKFGELSESTIQQVRAASSGELHRWADQILTASTIEDTLA